VLARLACLREIKQAQPQTTLLAFSVLMRITRGNDAEEEKPYWADLRRAHLSPLGTSKIGRRWRSRPAAEPAKSRRCAARFRPKSCRFSGWAAPATTPSTGHMIDWAAAGVFDYLIIPQDDTVDYGWNIAESRRLRRAVSKLGGGACVDLPRHGRNGDAAAGALRRAARRFRPARAAALQRRHQRPT
jgi:hypothetical protein